MKNIHFLLLFLLTLVSCQAQDQIDKKKEKQAIQEAPKGTWKVHKEFDENGNLISYDSTYVYSSKDFKNFPEKMDLDSLMKNYKSFFKQATPFDWEPNFSMFNQTDSLFNKNFFDNSFFLENWNQKQNKEMIEMMKKMDSIKKRFLEEKYN